MLKDKKVNKRLESTKKYIDALSAKYSKLNVIRIDLGYRKLHNNKISQNDASADFSRMLNNRRGKQTVFGEQVGYICKKEHTEDKGSHFHVIFFFNGNKVLKDAYKAKQIGEYWEHLTDKKGSYHNCHLNKYKDNGIGVIEHSNIEKRKNLDKAVSYLCKEDGQEIEKSNKKDRAFIRGTIPKEKNKLGRKRKDKQQ
ncbi:MAG: hypothetical protein COA66_13790 [Arcobacter sp.]|nr:MAG: hypothetical protein COA66_13790 [Arcobacter sp.]